MAVTSPSVFLAGNITYATNDGSSGLTIVAEDSVLIPLNVPDSMTVHGIFVAQGGLYGRNYYTNSYNCNHGYCVGSTWASYVTRSQLTTEGSVVSKLVPRGSAAATPFPAF